ncbi:hypothetical protein WICPIJ_007275 [Wickerhamomyces pijperi]|uniref:Tyrosine-protein phosphatase CDC14 n=1 Tax=Wickerhamomyces pijperi TaxID=599730 RepID=A0A9P8Q0U3_WICPI|nr:hypothetical protein WICPIJ_007275 [Wickerhamomyces pijperi]
MSRRSKIDAIEILKGRIYLGAYDQQPQNTADYVYFTVDDSLPYNPFHLDFGPLNIGHLYRFAVVLHNLLNEEANQGKAIVLYSSTDFRMRTNTACLLACYMVLVQSWTPHQILQPLCQLDTPFMGFRDAGYSHADFEITIQDIVYAMWRAKERGMIDITNFNLEEYEQYERVDQGDFNVVSKDFIAFASPQQPNSSQPNLTFRRVLEYFTKNDVQMVVRLNSHLYNKNEFEKRGIQHIDMIFDDGTCPTMDIVKDFIGVSEGVIKNGGKVAVHCKAGLGRTGCLIGAHLIYTHGFTANECIAYMRMIRPGMVVGPQQHWLYLHQFEFREWKYTQVLDNMPLERLNGFSTLITYEEFKARQRQERSHRESIATPVRRKVSMGTANLHKSVHRAVPMESPGQPRKGTEGRRISTNLNVDTQDVNSDYEEDDQYHSTKENIYEDQVLGEESIEEDPQTKITNMSSPPDASIINVLPKQRRIVSGARGKKPASNGGIRKISNQIGNNRGSSKNI